MRQTYPSVVTAPAIGEREVMAHEVKAVMVGEMGPVRWRFLVDS